MTKKDEHYVDNKEFHNILKENKLIVKEHFKEFIKDIDFSYGVEKLNFEKQVTVFEIKQIKHFLKDKKITLSNTKKNKMKSILKKISAAIKLEKSLKSDNDDVIEEHKEKLNKKKILKKLESYNNEYSDFLINLDLDYTIKKEISKLKKKEIERLRILEIKKRENKYLIQLLINNNIPNTITYKRLQNKLGNIFLSICKGVLTKPNFINYTPDRKDDMISEATFHMSRYVLLFDTEQENPFAYFTTVCTRAFLQCINKQKKYTEKIQPLEYIENMHKIDNLKVDDWG